MTRSFVYHFKLFHYSFNFKDMDFNLKYSKFPNYSDFKNNC